MYVVLELKLSPILKLASSVEWLVFQIRVTIHIYIYTRCASTNVEPRKHGSRSARRSSRRNRTNNPRVPSLLPTIRAVSLNIPTDTLIDSSNRPSSRRIASCEFPVDRALSVYHVVKTANQTYWRLLSGGQRLAASNLSPNLGQAVSLGCMVPSARHKTLGAALFVPWRNI